MRYRVQLWDNTKPGFPVPMGLPVEVTAPTATEAEMRARLEVSPYRTTEVYAEAVPFGSTTAGMIRAEMDARTAAKVRDAVSQAAIITAVSS